VIDGSELAVASRRSLIRRRVVDPVIELLKRGSTPRQISISIAIGAVIGIFPVLGTTTAICLVLAWGLRLNIAAMQLPNLLVYPVQLVLIVPFIRFGERLFSSTPMPLSLPRLVELFQTGTLKAIAVLWRSLAFASVAWLLVAPAAIAALYVIVLPLVRRLAALYAAARTQPAAL
jgi:uncharacterized protein (DUF2062 family)